MPAVYLHRLTVRPAEIDLLGHANNLVYLQWMIDAALAHSAAQGWDQQRHLDAQAGWVVRSHQITYLAPALVDQQLTVRTWVAETKRVTSLRRYEIVRDDDQAALARAETLWAFVDFQSGAPRRIPPDVAAAFEIVSDPDAVA